MNNSPFHGDELTAQRKAGVITAGAGIRSDMPDQHRDFFAALRYVLLCVIAPDGWPVAMMLTGEPGFISSPDAQTLRIALTPQDQGLYAEAFSMGQNIGLLGIDLSNRRRNRANGHITAAQASQVTIAVNQSFGNCPKYIQRRTAQSAACLAAAAEELPHLDEAARALIAGADTFFIASRSRPQNAEGAGADISHRGGQPGFIHIHGDELWIPDFRGNNYFNTIGNLLGEPRAALLFIDFETGDLLHLQGHVQIQWDSPAAPQFAGAERHLRFQVYKGWRRKAALPLRWSRIDESPGDFPTQLFANRI